MRGSGDSRVGARRLIDGAAKAAFVEALRRGVRLAEAGREVGFTIEGFYGARRRDEGFARAWVAALAESAARERGEEASGAGEGVAGGESPFTAACGEGGVEDAPHVRGSSGERSDPALPSTIACGGVPGRSCPRHDLGLPGAIQPGTPPLRAPLGEDLRIVPNNRRRAQVRRMRQVKFNDARKDKFLAHFAGTCDARGAAAAAGVDHSTVYKHRTRDADFREAWQEALETGYARLEAELVRERLAAQERIRDAIAPEGEPELEFERAIKLLMRWERRNGRLGARTQSPGRHRQPSFDEAIEALAKRLKSLDIPIKYLPAPEGEERLSASAPPAP